MDDPTQAALQRALDITLAMTEAASSDNWTLVAELDEQRRTVLPKADTAGSQHRETLLALEAHNRALLERAGLVRAAMEQQISRHQYNHRALRTYITSSR
ncbi:hypothetical protein ISP15_05115 [Dyella jejuensis]|uniref:Flagellar protein FliT n=1 Tax=Dyella jejuensis TaxID=1432009 RepID=A0ABW8JGT3_9GAMM